MNSAYAVELTKNFRAGSKSLSIATDIILIACGALLLSLLARVEIPMVPVPITGQSLGVLLIGAGLGFSRSIASVACYLGLGAIGVPVFASGKLGLAALFGPTGGFLFSFIVAAAAVGFLCERGWDRKFGMALLTFGLGHAIIFAIGVPWLSFFVGGKAAIMSGLLPFLPGMVIKTAIATAMLPLLWQFSPVRNPIENQK